MVSKIRFHIEHAFATSDLIDSGNVDNLQLN